MCLNQPWLSAHLVFLSCHQHRSEQHQTLITGFISLENEVQEAERPAAAVLTDPAVLPMFPQSTGGCLCRKTNSINLRVGDWRYTLYSACPPAPAPVLGVFPQIAFLEEEHSKLSRAWPAPGGERLSSDSALLQEHTCTIFLGMGALWDVVTDWVSRIFKNCSLQERNGSEVNNVTVSVLHSSSVL